MKYNGIVVNNGNRKMCKNNNLRYDLCQQEQGDNIFSKGNYYCIYNMSNYHMTRTALRALSCKTIDESPV